MYSTFLDAIGFVLLATLLFFPVFFLAVYFLACLPHFDDVGYQWSVEAAPPPPPRSVQPEATVKEPDVEIPRAA